MKKLLKIVLSILTLWLSACSDNLLIENPPDIIGPDALYKNYAGFQSGINGLYASVVELRSGDTHGSNNNLISFLMNAGTDVIYANHPSSMGRMLNQWGARNSADFFMYKNIWKWLYATINAANTIIDRAQDEKIDWTEDQKNVIVAQARCIRAWCYRHLTYLWGAVPLKLQESKGSNIRFNWIRTPVDSVRMQMEKDWLFAEQHLPDLPPKHGMLCKGVAKTYLAELYLAEAGKNPPYNTNNLLKAKNLTKDLIDNGPFSLVTKRYGVEKDQPGTAYTDMFIPGNSTYREGNTGALWVFNNEYQVPGGNNYNIMRRWYVNRYYHFLTITLDRGGRGIGRGGPTNFMLRLYGKNDDRGSKFAWRYFYIYKAGIDDIPQGKQPGDTISLYKNRDERTQDDYWISTRKWDAAPEENVTAGEQFNDQVYMRLAETYLLLAEAQYKLGDLPGAAQTINALRSRAHASPVASTDINMDFILDERARELWSEGERRYTLLRTHKWYERTKLYNKVAGPNIARRDTIFPIPQSEIDANNQGGLKQNPDY